MADNSNASFVLSKTHRSALLSPSPSRSISKNTGCDSTSRSRTVAHEGGDSMSNGEVVATSNSSINTTKKAVDPTKPQFPVGSSFNEAFSFVTSSSHYKPPSTSLLGTLSTSSNAVTAPPAFPTTANTITTATNPPSSHALRVGKRQKGNPVLKSIRNVPWEFDNNIVADFMPSDDTVVLYLSLRYHLLHPDYITRRVKELHPSRYRLAVLLCQVDLSDSAKTLQQVNVLGVKDGLTVILAWSSTEAARYLETFKAYENKSSSSIQERVDEEFLPRLTSALKGLRAVNKSDVAQLRAAFGPLRALLSAEQQEIGLVPGVGEKKVRRLHTCFNASFKSKRQKVQQQQQQERQHQPSHAAAPPPAKVAVEAETV